MSVCAGRAWALSHHLGTPAPCAPDARPGRPCAASCERGRPRGAPPCDGHRAPPMRARAVMRSVMKAAPRRGAALAGGHGSIGTCAPAHLQQLPPHTHWLCVLHGLQTARPLIKKDDGGGRRRAHANLARGKLARLRPRAPRPRSPEARAERQCGGLARLGGILGGMKGPNAGLQPPADYMQRGSSFPMRAPPASQRSPEEFGRRGRAFSACAAVWRRTSFAQPPNRVFHRPSPASHRSSRWCWKAWQ